jgi:hypothetical protein
VRNAGYTFTLLNPNFHILILRYLPATVNHHVPVGDKYQNQKHSIQEPRLVVTLAEPMNYLSLFSSFCLSQFLPFTVNLDNNEITYARKLSIHPK